MNKIGMFETIIQLILLKEEFNQQLCTPARDS